MGENDKNLDSLRAQLQRAAPGLADTLIATLTEALSATKKVRVQRACQKCGCKHIEYVEIQDPVGAVNAAKVLIEQSDGRPGVAGEGGKDQVRIVRWVAPDPSLLDLPAWQALARAGDIQSLGELRDAILSAGHEVLLYGSP